MARRMRRRWRKHRFKIPLSACRPVRSLKTFSCGSLSERGGGRGGNLRGDNLPISKLKTGSGLSVTRIRRRCSGKQLRTARSRPVTRKPTPVGAAAAAEGEGRVRGCRVPWPFVHLSCIGYRRTRRGATRVTIRRLIRGRPAKSTVVLRQRGGFTGVSA